MTPPIEISGSVSVVTGGASGIGKGITKALLKNGGSVVIADIEEQPIDDTVSEFEALGPVEGYVTDVSKYWSCVDDMLDEERDPLIAVLERSKYCSFIAPLKAASGK